MSWLGGTTSTAPPKRSENSRRRSLNSVAPLRDLITQLRADSAVQRWVFDPYDEIDETDALTNCRAVDSWTARERSPPSTAGGCASTAQAMWSTAAGAAGRWLCGRYLARSAGRQG